MSVEASNIPRDIVRSPGAGVASLGIVARRAIRGALIWSAVFGLVVWSEVTNFAKVYPTAADRALAAATYGSNVGLQAIFGPVHHIDTVAGYTAFHMVGVLGLIGAVWGLLTGTRLLRGEEEAGRWEMLLAGPTTRRRAAANALAGLGVALLTLWAVTAVVTTVMGRGPDADFSVTASLFAAATAVAPAAIFLAVGAFCSELASTRRQAAGLAAGALGVVYLIRVVAYSGGSVRWLRWASPLGWVDELRPLTQSRPLVLVPIVATVGALAATAIVLAGRRDLGAGVLPANDSAPPRTRFLNDPLGLAHRLGHRTAFGWIGGLAGGGLVMGLIIKSASVAMANQSGGIIQRLSGAAGGSAYAGIIFLLAAILVGLAAAGQVAATRDEEAEGYLDHLLARPVGRLTWLAGRVGVSVVVLVGTGVSIGLLTWVGAASTGAGISLSTLLAAGVNVVPIGIFVLGVGTLVLGLAPRFAAVAAYGLVAWSFLVSIVGGAIGAGQWLLDLSIIQHVARAPAEPVRWDGVAILVALGLAAAALGAWRFGRRDLAGE